MKSKKISFAEFNKLLKKKMRAGRKEHGPAPDLDGCATELEAELLDIVGWGFLLWKRLRKLENKISKK